MSGSQDHLARIFGRVVRQKGARITIKETADLVGEMANQILGKIKQFFVERGHTFGTSTPVFLRGDVVEVRNRSGQPSLIIPFRELDGTIYLQFAFDTFDPETLGTRREDTNSTPKEGEVQFL